MSELDGVRGVFRMAAQTLVPETAGLDAAGWEALEATVDKALGDRPPRLRAQMRLFLRVIEWLPVPVLLHRFSRLPDARRVQVLAALESAPVSLLRRGFWGLKTLVLMGQYTRPAVVAAIGYRAQARGWEARR